MLDATVMVAAVEHPERDEWIDARAEEEAASQGIDVPDYQGVWLTPDRVPVHLFCPADRLPALADYGYRRCVW